MAYKLSATLSGHTQDVRAVCSPKTATVLSASRDSTARIWARREDAHSTWTESAILQGHEGFVGSAASSTLADGTLVAITGGNDSVINLWDVQASSSSSSNNNNPIRTLLGHSSNVCCLNATQDGLLASGSWDATAKIWDLNDTSGDCTFTLTGSELSIWAVLILPGSTREQIHTLTASADKLIRLYTNNKPVRTFKGHTQPVRALALLTGHEDLFASASNDGSIRIWNYKTGEDVKTLDGHDSFVYSLACTPEGDLVSSGEDRSVRIWDRSSGELKQVITIPAISIWSVAIVSGTSDIVVGSSDAQVRIFTTDTTRQASAGDLKAYDDLIASSTVSTTQIGDIKKTDLPDEKALLDRKGKKEGDVMMVKNSVSGNVDAFQWSSASNEWINVGTVVDAVGSGRKQLYEGKEYDYVFDVDVSEGAPPLKLPYNVSQNPYEAAQQFLLRNDLPNTYIDEVVRFIEKNTGGATLGGPGGVDPYTGTSSYRTGGGAASQPPSNPSQSTFSGDPWSRSSTSSSPTPSLLPHKTPLNFTQANIAALHKKLLDFNKQLSEQPNTATEFPLNDSELSTLQTLVDSLKQPSAVFALDDASIAIIEKLLEWPISYRFPALDLVRVTALHAPAPIASSGILFTLLSHVTPNPSATLKENETNSMLAVRAVANCFNKPEGRKALAETAPEALETLAVVGVPDGVNKNGKVALATVALNYSILAVEGSLKGDSVAHLGDFILALLADDDTEVHYRALVALGNVGCAPDAVKGSVQVGTLQALKSRAQTLAKKSTESRIKNIVSELERKI